VNGGFVPSLRGEKTTDRVDGAGRAGERGEAASTAETAIEETTRITRPSEPNYRPSTLLGRTLFTRPHLNRDSLLVLTFPLLLFFQVPNRPPVIIHPNRLPLRLAPPLFRAPSSDRGILHARASSGLCRSLARRNGVPTSGDEWWWRRRSRVWVWIGGGAGEG
jgi:hypothetical protein